MKDKTKEEQEMKEYLSSNGYFKKVDDLRKKKNNILEIKLFVSLEIIPEVTQKLGKDSREIKNLINKILI